MIDEWVLLWLRVGLRLYDGIAAMQISSFSVLKKFNEKVGFRENAPP